MRAIFFAITVPLFLFSCATEKTKQPQDEENLSDNSLLGEVEEPLNEDSTLGEDDTAEDAITVDESLDTVNETSSEEENDPFTDTEETVSDADGEPVIPFGCLQGTFTPYFGNFHSHTSNSDGEGDPDTAFAYARDVGGLDILAVTDHLEQLYYYYTGVPSDEYPKCRASAVAASTGTFLGICGYEYGSARMPNLIESAGHSNVFFNDKLFPMVQTDFHDYYASVAACPQCITQFNHPGDESLNQTFNHFEFDPSVYQQMALYEFNGAGPVWDLFFEALAAGWWLSPAFNQDNHSANWGTANDNRTGVFMASLDIQSLYDAFAQRRTFAASDKNAVIIFMAQDVCWMGSRLSGRSHYTLTVSVSDPDEGDTFDTIELYDPLKNPIAVHDCGASPSCKFSFDLMVTMPTYVVSRAVQSDGQIIVAAPIWMTP